MNASLAQVLSKFEIMDLEPLLELVFPGRVNELFSCVHEGRLWLAMEVVQVEGLPDAGWSQQASPPRSTLSEVRLWLRTGVSPKDQVTVTEEQKAQPMPTSFRAELKLLGEDHVLIIMRP